METEENRTLSRWLPFIPAILALLVFGNTLGNQYAYDDFSVILDHEFVQAGFEGLGDIFTTPNRYGSTRFNDGLYRPLTLATFALETGLFGNNPLVQHLTNILLYALCGVFLTLLLVRWLGEKRQAMILVATMIFIAHPLHTEAVANIKGRDEILCFLFFTLSALAATRYHDKKGILPLILAGLFFALSFLSKEGAVTFAVAIPLALFFFRGWEKRTIPILGGVYLGIAALMILLHTQVIHGAAFPPPTGPNLLDNSVTGADGFGERLGTGIFLTGKYILKCFFPHPLAHDYSYNQIPLKSLASLLSLLALAGIIGLGYLAAKGWKKRTPLSFGILFFMITISLYTNIFLFIGIAFAERVTFTPLLGFSLAIASVIASPKIIPARQFARLRNPRFLLLLIVVVAFSGKSIHRNAEWKDNFTLYSADVDTVSDSARAQFNYATAIEQQAWKQKTPREKRHLLDESYEYFRKAIAILPGYWEAMNGLASLHIKENQPDEAISLLNDIISRLPDNHHANYNLGVAFFLKERYPEAIQAFLKYRDLGPDLPMMAGCHYHLGRSHGFLKNYDSAIEELKEAIRLNPGYWEAHLSLGKAYGIKNLPDDSRKALLRAWEIQPDNIDINLSLGINYFNEGAYSRAIPHLEKILFLSPEHQGAQQILTDALRRRKNPENEPDKQE